ncbi:MAG TPA: hypothetical protein DIS98_01620 [Colwellia sp.]|nr:hypothetical protein [Colwellia sp.]|tara:strand:- start:202 stop:588 length:387 start_codon:yes stop_codon:yes gene_type:complete
MSTFIKLFFSLLLIYVAYLQLNDPDPYFWVFLYLICAIVPGISLFKPHKLRMNLFASIAAFFCFTAMVMSWHGSMEYLSLHFNNESLIQDMSPNKPYIEEAREFFGTLFALCIVLVFWRLDQRKTVNT